MADSTFGEGGPPTESGGELLVAGLPSFHPALCFGSARAEATEDRAACVFSDGIVEIVRKKFGVFA